MSDALVETLFHFSENPTIDLFRPHIALTSRGTEPFVWALDKAHAPGYWFPRDCPRACCWADETAVIAPAGAALLSLGGIRRMHAIEGAWLARVRHCRLFVYEFDAAPFEPEIAEAGYWVVRVHNTGLPVTYTDLLVVLKRDAGHSSGSAGPHEYEQYGIENVNETGDTLKFEVYRGEASNTYLSLSFSGDHATGKARIERASGVQFADVVLDRVPLPRTEKKQEHVDLTVMEQIRREGLERSQVMDGAYYLTEQYGPRLFGSRNFKLAGDWLVKWLSEIGLAHITEEPIPNPHTGWQCDRFTIHQLEPTFSPLLGAPPAWATARPGPISGEAVMLAPTIGDSRDAASFFDRYRGRLRGKFVLIDQPQT